ncbi:MAG: DNA polymerase sliding clamp [Candidatus Methanospirare jalkutatii]|nr:DNA polymerase sliding clamp [Candidatus Methanospirare jalkutatii]
MFRARIDASLLRECVEAVLAVVDEARLKIGEEAWKVRAVDPANVALVDLELSREAFDEYAFSPPSSPSSPSPPTPSSPPSSPSPPSPQEEGAEEGSVGIEIGVDFGKFNDILRSGWRKGTVSIILEDKDKLLVQLDALSYTISLLDVSSLRKEPKIPALEFSTRVVVDADDFKRTIKAAERIGDHIAMGVEEDKFYMEAEGEMEKMCFSLRKDELLHLSGSDCRSLFSLEYLAAMAKGISSETLTLFIGTDYPLKMEFEIAEGFGKVIYLLAPRIEAE